MNERRTIQVVIPAKAGIQIIPWRTPDWIPAFAGMTIYPSISILALFLLISPHPADAEIRDRPNPLDLHGYVLMNHARRTTGDRPAGGVGGDYVLREQTLLAEASIVGDAGNASIFVKGTLRNDDIDHQADAKMREGYWSLTHDGAEVRLGRQILTWGVGDLFFINDVFPKDWESYFSGRPAEFLKRGIDGMVARAAMGDWESELALVPLFTPDRMPSADRFFFFDPYAGVANRSEQKPATRLAHTEIAGRIYRSRTDFDLSFYLYRGYRRTPMMDGVPSAAPTRVTLSYPTIAVYGASIQKNAGDGVLSAEAGYYDALQDRKGNDPLIPNSEWRGLIGYQRALSEDVTIGWQGYAEWIQDYGDYRGALAAASPVQDRMRLIGSLRLTAFRDYQRWKYSFFLAHSPTDRDLFFQPEISRKLTDRLSVALIGNFFAGRSDRTFFGQFEKSDGVSAAGRYDF